MSNPLVSIIIPVYNGEKWIERCLNSATRQTYSNIEIIVVDDGSRDNSGVICDRLVLSDTRIKVFHQENGGVNSARGEGVKQSTGDWLVFLDADDTLPSNAIELYSAFFHSGADILVPGDEGGVINKEDYLEALLCGEIEPGVCLKSFNAAFYKKYSPCLGRDLVMGEDLLINLVVGMHASIIRKVKGELYEINDQNSDSVTKLFKKTWEYEKHYFGVMESLFLDKCKYLDSYDLLELLVRKFQINGIKYVLLSGNKIDYKDESFLRVERFAIRNKDTLGPSERLLFKVKNPFLYTMIIRFYLRLKSLRNDS